METLTVVCAVLRDTRGHLLLCRRAPGRREAGLWEFPGGKLEAGETAAQALRRELREELGHDCVIGPEQHRSFHTYAHGRIELIAHNAEWPGGNPLLHDHDMYNWVQSSDLPAYELAPADIPLARHLQQHNGTDVL